MKVAVLKGGRSLERSVSLRSGARVEDALERLGHDVVGVDVGGDLVSRLRELRPDVAFVALHGRDGEDGTVQELLEVAGIPYTGSGVSACIRCSDKVLAKHLMRDAGLPTPDFYAFNETAFRELGAAEALGAMEERLAFPIVVKPAGQGSALGIKFARTAAEVPAALVAAFSYDRKVRLPGRHRRPGDRARPGARPRRLAAVRLPRLRPRRPDARRRRRRAVRARGQLGPRTDRDVAAAHGRRRGGHGLRRPRRPGGRAGPQRSTSRVKLRLRFLRSTLPAASIARTQIS